MHFRLYKRGFLEKNDPRGFDSAGFVWLGFLLSGRLGWGFIRDGALRAPDPIFFVFE